MLEQTNLNKPNSSQSYANKTRQNVHKIPKKSQAIVLNSVDGIKIEDYVYAIGDKIGPTNIIYVSRISMNRVCIYLTEEEHVNELCNKYKKICVNDIEINIRPLITPAKRLILSNVSPTIPNSTIENEFRKAGLKLISTIHDLRAPLQNKNYAHVMSFRRQVFIQPEENLKIPESLIVTDDEDNTPFRIFINEESNQCEKCKRYGHNSEQCNPTNKPEQIQQDVQATNQQEVQATNQQENKDASKKMPNLQTQEIQQKKIPQSKYILRKSTTTSENNFGEMINLNNFVTTSKKQTTKPKEIMEAPTPSTSTNKRPPNSNSESNDQSDDNWQQTQETKGKKQIPKKIKQTQTPNENIKKIIQEHFEKCLEKYTVSSQQLTNILEESFKSQDPLQIIRENKIEPNEVIEIINNIYPVTQSQSTKNRLTRLIKKINLQIEEETDGEMIEDDKQDKENDNTMEC